MTTSGTGSGTGSAGTLGVDPARLGQAATVLDGVAGSLSGAAPRLRLKPDAGVSTDEVGTALEAVATAVAGLAQEVRSAAESTRASAADFTATDQAVSTSMQQRRGALAP